MMVYCLSKAVVGVMSFQDDENRLLMPMKADS